MKLSKFWLTFPFLSNEYRVQTINKYVKRRGEYVEYKYYASKKDGTYISENKIVDKIKEEVLKETKELENKVQNYYSRLKTLYLRGHIDIKELEVYKEQINKNEEKINIIDNIKHLRINKNILNFKINNKEYKVSL